MDTLIKIIIISLLHLIVTPANATMVDISDANGTLSGWIKNADGNYSQTSTNSIRSLVNNTTLSVAEKFPIQTTKGIFQADITRTASVDLARMGKTVSGLAVLGGPAGMTITAVSLVCELTNICKNALDEWRLGYVNETLPSGSTIWNCSGFGDMTLSACKQNIHQCSDPTYVCYDDSVSSDGLTYTFYKKYSANNQVIGQPYLTRSTAWVPNNNSGTVPTASDWTSKEQLLNDPRFTPELLAKDQPVPIGIPSLPSVWKAPIDKTTTTLKDGSGNVTGTEESTTEAEISNPTPQENPSNNPNLVKVIETTVKNTYNINNQLTSSTTTTTGNQPQQPQPQGFEIDIDNMTDQPLEERAIPGTFSYTSWGSGSCPADRSVSYHYGTLNLTFQPACEAAIMANPVIIAIAGLAAMFIISGALRND